MSRRKLEALADDRDKLLVRVGDAAAGAAERKARTQHAGVAHALGDGLGICDGIGIAGACHLEADLGHGLVEKLAVLAALDGGKVAADHLDAVLVERAVLGELDGGVEAGLAAERGQQRVGVLFLDHALDELGGDGLHVGAVGKTRVGHDRGRVGVDEDDLVTVLFEDLAGLGARIVELAGLADHDGAGADDENALDIGTFGHVSSPPSRQQPQRPRQSSSRQGDLC